MTRQGYRARIACIEWHGNLWLKYGGERSYCEQMIRHCTECVEADFYGAQRPIAPDVLIARMQVYFDKLFAQPPTVFPSGRVVSFA